MHQTNWLLPRKVNTKTTTQKETQPDMRFAIQQRSKANSKKGQGPTKTTTNKDLPWTQWYKATVSQLKIMHQTNWLLPSKVKHAFLIVAADRQQRNALAVHNCVLASQSPLTGVQSKTKRTCRVPTGVFMSRESVLIVGGQIAIVPPPLRGAAPWLWQGRSHKAR